MATNFPFEPYYDDFDHNKNFRKILFKPSLPVQARELTQLQSILQDQIKKFGDHVFKHGSLVIPGNSFSDLSVSYVKLQTLENINSNILENKFVINSVGVKANIRKVGFVDNNPVLYIGYISGGSDGSSIFSESEILTVEGTGISLTVAEENATGISAMAFLNSGVFYVRGSFVNVERQSVVISGLDETPNCRVVLRIIEEIITTDDDESLLDPAQGVPNFAAPGADRHKISLVLESLPLFSLINDNYIELMRYNDGILEEHLRYAQYNELEKNLARRTFDESGNYVVNGLDTEINEHLKTNLNGGVFPPPIGNIDKFVAEIDTGKAYIQGFEVEKISPTRLILDKGRTNDHIKTRNDIAIQPRFGQYLYVTNLVSLPIFNQLTQVTLWNDDDPANGSATQVGTARVLAIDYQEGDPSSVNAIYRLYFTDLVLTGTSVESIGGIRFSGGSMRVLQQLIVPGTVSDFTAGEIVNFNTNVRTATVTRWTRSTSVLYVYKHDHTKDAPRLGDRIIGASSGAAGTVNAKEVTVTNPETASILEIPVGITRRVRNQSNLPDISYKSYRELLVVTNGSGSGSATVSGMTIDPIEAGNTIIVGPSGVVALSTASLNPAGTELTITGGPASVSLRVIVAVTKTAVAAKNKTLVRTTLNVPSPTTTISLQKADIYRVVSIIDTTGDITNRYTLDNGQRDYAYTVGSITLNGATPTGALSITFDYFEHDSSGDYFAADSYENTLGPDYLTLVPRYKSRASGREFDLRNCLDFRPRQGDNGTYSVGTARLIDLVQVDSRITTSVQYFVPRIDLVFINKDGRIGVVTGTPNDSPAIPLIPNSTMPLSTIFIPAYTEEIKDIVVTKARNKGYTMSDVSQIENRLFNLEQYTLLTQTESNLINFEIIDAETGLSRFKSGYLVETFNNPDVISDIFSEEFTVTYAGGNIIPRTERMDVPLNIINSESLNFVNTGGLITLPYTEKVFIEQPLSTRITNVNPFAVYSWTGSMTLIPSFDNWVEQEFLPRIFNEQTITNNVTVRRPWNWVPPSGQNVQFIAPPAPIAPAIQNTIDSNAITSREEVKIICTELYNLGLMDKITYEADQEFGKNLLKHDPILMLGYHRWAKLVVEWMRGESSDLIFWIKNKEKRSNTIKNWSIKWAYEIATPWAEEMSFMMGKRERGSVTGKVLMSIGKTASKLIGKFTRGTKENKCIKFKGYSLILIFSILLILTRIIKTFENK
jgi:hypothetical protein